jgi:aminoglycoside phosphotransferase (APT) family kinase protein
VRPAVAPSDPPETWAPGAPSATLSEFVAASGLRSVVVGASKDPNAKITILLVSGDGGRPVLAIKAPTTDAAASAVEAEARLLATLRRLHAEPLTATVPAVVDVVEFGGRAAIVFTALPGTPMTTSYLRWRHTARRARVAADFAAVEKWLAGFQAATAQHRGPVDMDGGVALRLSARFSDEERLGADLDALAGIHGRLQGEAVPRAAVHGDLWMGNVLLHAGQASGVVDWEAGCAIGEPVRDLVRFALMYALYLDRRTPAGRRVAGHAGLRAGERGAALRFALDGTGWFPEIFRRFVADGLARLGASPSAWRDAVLAGLAEVAALTDDPEFGRQQLHLFRRLTSAGATP